MSIFNENCKEGIKRMRDSSVDLVLCDPPYGMDYQSNYRKEKYDKICHDDSFFLDDDFMTEVSRVLKNDRHLYFFCSFHMIDLFKQSIEKHFTFKNILIWEKNNTSMGDLFGDYAPKYEMIIYATKGKRDLRNGRDSNILKFNRTKNENHPTEKPVDLLEYLIVKSSEPGEVVIDFTMGSGSTGVAAKQKGRQFIGFELNEKHFNTAQERLDDKNFTQTSFLDFN